MPKHLAPAANAAAQPRRFFPGDRVTRTAIQSENDPFEFVMSTDSVDRIGDIVDIKGIDLKAFRQNPLALWNHDADTPIGVWSQVTKEAGRLLGKLTLSEPGSSPLVDRLRSFIEQRILRAVSIGFRVLAADELEPGNPWGGLRFTKTELLECSLVSIPANNEALRIRGLGSRSVDSQIFLPAKGNTGPGAAGAAAAGKQRAPAPLSPPTLSGARPMPRTLAERITAQQQRAAAIDGQISAIETAASNDDDRDFTDDENDSLAALAEEKKACVKSINTLTDMEGALAAKARPMGQLATLQRGVEPRFAVKEPPGAIIGKMATVAALAFMTGRGADSIIAERYRDDDRIKDCWDYSIRSASNIADTTTPGWAKELVAQDVAALMDDLVNVSVFAALRARASSPDVTFDGAGSISIPRRTQGNLAGAWVGEAGVIPVLQGQLTAVALTPTKLAGITTFTRELQTATTSQIETILRNGLRDDTADLLDKALLSTSAARANVRPAGILNGVTGTPSTGADPEAIRADITAAVAPIIAAGGGRDIVLIVNPLAALYITSATTLNGDTAFPEVQQGSLMGYSLIQSLNVPTGNLIAVDAADFASGAGVPEYRVSEEATLTMANADGTPPTQAVKADGTVDVPGEVGPDLGIKVAGGAVGAGTANIVAMSMFQQYSVALRMVLPVHWIMRRAGMVGLVTGFPDTTP